ncbi:MAG TPA: ABC transporter ATP-binding protein [Syntrophomonadaceae bacterium]|mgnify:CR=1 FL=1|nr:ABC transporter ATP-binding protein [Syntrophomonadaceae bacterium]HNX29935.1 ABC transporter ATP-binding protein [Syntrophomonadaceae bacterium]HPR94072.1 ABC transporter ATP-binding protein [Syntrophomonadaceae bacterium]
MNANVIMQLVDVSKTYIMGEVEVKALKPSTLEFYKGELAVILGPSGSGKSTLLNIMGGMDLPTEGKVIFADQDLSTADDNELTYFRRNEVGFVFQFYNLISDLTARENIELASELVDSPLAVDECLQDVGLLDRRDSFPSQLSGGEQQRVSIARAVVKNPRILLCDEPTGALDYKTGILILSLIRKINQKSGCTVVLITHNSAIAAMGDRVIRMRSGEIADITVNQNPIDPERIEW